MAKNKNTVVELVETTTEIEAPYELPEGWKWCRLGDVAEYINGRAFKPEEWESEGKPIIRIQNLTNSSDTTNYSTQDFEQKYLVKSGDLLFAWSASLGAYIWNREDGWLNQHIFKVVPYSNIDKMYLYNALIQVTEHLYSKTHGSGMVHVTLKPFLNTMIPLPPTLDEQQRIVNRIETLFAKLDQAKEKAQNVVDTFETRKASILHKAFTGELTKKWREENGVGEDSWVEKLFSELGKSNLGKMLDAKKNTGSDVLYLRNVNVRWFDFDLTDLLTMKAKNEEIKKLSLKKGDLFICEGGEPGRCAVWKEEDSNIIFQKAIHRFKPNNNVSSDFIAFSLFYLNSIGQLSNYFTGTTIKHLTGQSLAKIKISLPSLPEQTEIVRILDAIFEKETKAKQSAEAVLEQIDLLKKSILARAFRGEI